MINDRYLLLFFITLETLTLKPVI